MVVIHGSLEGIRRTHSAIGYGTAQLWFDHASEPTCGEYGTVPAQWERQDTIKRCELFGIGKAFGTWSCRSQFSATNWDLYKDWTVVKFMVRQTAPQRGCMVTLWCVLWKIAEEGLKQQLKVWRVEAHVTDNNNKMKETHMFNTKGNDEADELAQTTARMQNG